MGLISPENRNQESVEVKKEQREGRRKKKRVKKTVVVAGLVRSSNPYSWGISVPNQSYFKAQSWSANVA